MPETPNATPAPLAITVEPHEHRFVRGPFADECEVCGCAPDESKAKCQVCGKPVHAVGGSWVHDQPHDPFAPPIHAPRPRKRVEAIDGIRAIAYQALGIARKEDDP